MVGHLFRNRVPLLMIVSSLLVGLMGPTCLSYPTNFRSRTDGFTLFQERSLLAHSFRTGTDQNGSKGSDLVRSPSRRRTTAICALLPLRLVVG
jgi:hypothetical protein